MSKNWLGIEIFACCQGVIAGIGAYFMPESPKFLISKHRYEEARESINRIAKINKQNEFKGEFDREVADRRTKAFGVNYSRVTADGTFVSTEGNHNPALMSPK